KETNDELTAAKTGLQEVNDKLVETANELKASLVVVSAERARARHYFYAAQMALVDRAREKGDAGRVVQLLRSVIPENPEEEDPRGWERHPLCRGYCGEQSPLRG